MDEPEPLETEYGVLASAPPHHEPVAGDELPGDARKGLGRFEGKALDPTTVIAPHSEHDMPARPDLWKGGHGGPETSRQVGSQGGSGPPR
jgi:hypothetical protein